VVLERPVAAGLEVATGVRLADRSERSRAVAANSASSVLAFAFLMRFFTLEKASSMGFMSGE